jgi:hypothetical protein
VRDEAWGHCLEAARKWDMEFSFLGVVTTGPDNKQIFPKRQWGDYSHCLVEDLKIPWRPIVYSAPRGLGLIMTGSSFPQKNRKDATSMAIKLHESKTDKPTPSTESPG